MKIFIVQGHSGRYDSAHTWCVRAFASQGLAEELMELCNNYADKLSDRFTGMDAGSEQWYTTLDKIQRDLQNYPTSHDHHLSCFYEENLHYTIIDIDLDITEAPSAQD